MNSERSRPPALATWLLRHVCSRDQGVLIGDLLERFGEGESDSWFWRQVLMAVLIEVSRALRTHWPQIFFSVTGSIILWFWGARFLAGILANSTIRRIWDWGFGLEWPMSVVYVLGFNSFVAALMIQPILAALLFLDRKFRWVSLLRTLLISIPLIAANVIAFEIWASPGIASTMLFVSLILCTLLISAWFGCQTARGSTISGDKVFLAAKAVVTGFVVMCLLQAVSGMDSGLWGPLDQLNRRLGRTYDSGWIWSHWIIPAEIFIISAVCVRIASRLNRNYRGTMLAMVLIWWTLLFGYSTSSYWSKIVADSVEHPWFRPYLGSFIARFFAVIAGTVLGGLLSAPNESDSPSVTNADNALPNC